MNDMKLGKINKIIVYKLDRLTRSIKDLEMICTLLEENNCSLESVVEEINTETANGKFFIRMLTILAQLEIERTSERTKFELVGAVKKGHFSGQPPIGYDRQDKTFVINELESEVIKRIFDLYVKGQSVCSIVKLFNQENVLNKKWITTTIDKILSNRVYIGDYEHRKRVKNGKVELFENVCPAIIDKTTFEIVQKQKEKNLKNYTRKRTYIFMQKVICPKCHKIMGGCSSTSHTGKKPVYYQCACCKKRVSEKKIEKPLLAFLNDMLDYFLIIDNTFKPYLNNDIELELQRYTKLLEELSNKEKRIKKAFVDGYIEPKDLKDELRSITNQKNEMDLKIRKLRKTNESNNHKQELKTIFNMREIEKQKFKSHYFKEQSLWNKLSDEQKKSLITKYIDTIEIDFDKQNNVVIKNIIINKKELENIGYLFRSDCFDMVVNVEDQDVLFSNYQSKEMLDTYVSSLRKYYKVNQIVVEKELLDISDYLTNDTLEIIPMKKESKFEKDKFTLLQIGLS